MKTFTRFLSEETNPEPEGQKLKHLTHLEDFVIHHGNDGVKHAANIMDDVHKRLLGKETKTKVSVKYDGAPSIVFGHHPSNGRFFVASKSAFNKTPKLNYTDQDVEANHGHAPGLVEKLKHALKHLPKVAPRKGVYQGDMMYTKNDIQHKNGKYHFTPNTITYSTPEDSHHGAAIKHSKMGVVVHTKYEGKDLDNMGATPNVDRHNFRHHPDVHNIDPELKTDSHHYSTADQNKYHEHMENARKKYSSMKPEALDAVKEHSVHLETHINDEVKKNGKPSADGFIKHLTDKHSKEVSKLKSAAAVDRKHAAFSDKIKSVTQSKKHIDDALELHHHFQRAKDVLTRAMAKNAEFDHHIGGAKSSPEGAVAVRGGHMAKFVDRAEFSRQNFLASKMKMAKAENNEKV